ncbi:MAG: aminoacyl-tRNA hydrolase [Candidatus Bipolaricaulota bacterium]|nr:aminoacyl-tRNA hydrolase [Candidatus Bipolaricaulota bacterium]
MKAVFGLGNPGLEYALTRHNIGFDVVDLYRKRHVPQLKARLIGSALVYKSRDLFLVKPMTYMNGSGEAVKAVIDRFRIPRQDVLLVYDDLDIPLGEMKILAAGGSGSHKGMISVISVLGSEDIPRLRVGIGREKRPQDQVDYVLGRFTDSEWKTISSVLDRCVGAIDTFRTQDINTVMTRFNRRWRVVNNNQKAIL